ncbi:hypothetical protein BPAE_0252g00060 [Botrytis paeoniae]|uniref:Uncharacterized protein n=1 Tax=Botrytis paeoniae TaxID=278948 RepID=A0A4Z1FE39_9HELO|nr:hypothetical protein BPAE_0252g00060 [Botrytis paeoniae]
MRMGNRDVDGTSKGESLKFLGVEQENSGRGPIAFIGAVEHVLRWSSNSGAVDDYGNRKCVAMAETNCHRAIVTVHRSHIALALALSVAVAVAVVASSERVYPFRHNQACCALLSYLQKFSENLPPITGRGRHHGDGHQLQQ